MPFSVEWLNRCLSGEVRWRGCGDQPIEYNGLPFIVIGRQRFDCLWGPRRCGARLETATVSYLLIHFNVIHVVWSCVKYLFTTFNLSIS